ncbi:MAG: 2-phosphosulfolactate phosphatase, partial [Firmicutes bacterium]|nr:2-phosphosulfolactate phosphatase [Bacillota bacterium]
AGCQCRFSLEDSLYAGAVISELGEGFHLSDGASTCLTLYQRWQGSDLALLIASSDHGRRLEDLGFGEDIRLAAAVDSHPVLPIYRDGEIRLLSSALDS